MDCGQNVLMTDLKNPWLITAKGLSFLVIGVAAAVLLILEQPTVRVGVLLAISIWCFCRFYYFAFYVIQHYVDPGYRFSGLIAFCRYMLQRRNRPSDGGHNGK